MKYLTQIQVSSAFLDLEIDIQTWSFFGATLKVGFSALFHSVSFGCYVTNHLSPNDATVDPPLVLIEQKEEEMCWFRHACGYPDQIRLRTAMLVSN